MPAVHVNASVVVDVAVPFATATQRPAPYAKLVHDALARATVPPAAAHDVPVVLYIVVEPVEGIARYKPPMPVPVQT